MPEASESLNPGRRQSHVKPHVSNNAESPPINIDSVISSIGRCSRGEDDNACYHCCYICYRCHFHEDGDVYYYCYAASASTRASKLVLLLAPLHLLQRRR